MFSQTAEYALRAIAYLASQPDHFATIPGMSEAIQVNPPYLRKVFDRLRAADIVSTQRGTGGGVVLEIAPDDLTILDIVNAVDPVQRIERCPLGLPDHMDLCPLHSELDQAISQIEESLGRHTIGELLAKRKRKADQCEFPKEQDLYQL